MILRDKRSFAAFGHDLVAATAAWCVAFWLRFNFEIPDQFQGVLVDSLPWVVAIQGAVFFSLGLYRGIWRYASVQDLHRIILAALLSNIAIYALVVLANFAHIPRSVFLLDPLLLVVAMGGSRFTYRIWKERGAKGRGGQPLLIMGAGDAASDLLKTLARNPQWRVVGMLDDNPAKHRRQIQGVTVLGALDSLENHAHQHQVRTAIIAMPGVNHSARRRAMNLCAAAGVNALIVPSFEDIASGRVSVSQIRHVELDDLLGRDPVRLDSTGMQAWIGGRTILVTGAGGSIGSELCRQLARFHPAKMVLLEQSEFALYRLVEEFSRELPGLETIAVIADVRNAARVDSLFKEFRPTVVFHAAAYKHVPLMETVNSWEAAQNNIHGTLIVARAAIAANVAKLVLISTDKAVNPTNVMGATKRLAELVCANFSASDTRFITVRFGNVLGSTGSVVPKFREQIARGGPITVTHPDIQRYFMSIPEAAQLVLQAGYMGNGGEIFVLEMGEPVRIVDLARDMIRLSGLDDRDIGIVFTGLRPGEKLFEELLADGEQTLPTPHPKLRIAKTTTRLSAEEFESLSYWLASPDPRSDAEVREQLTALLAEYRPAQAPRADA
ncbi:MAG: polysaccharide biosynthesis protein [Burkholderiales bacterium]